MSNNDRHTKTEVGKRIDKCFELRYETEPSITQEKWVEYCHENYGDRSEQQYCDYWASAKKKHEESWKAKLEALLGPATDELFRLLADENPKVRQRAIDQIMEYSGNKVQKQEIKATVETITIGFGQE